MGRNSDYGHDDAFSWGQRTVGDVDYMNDQMERERLGCHLPPRDCLGGMEDDYPNVDSVAPGDGYLASKDLERFQPYSEPGCDVKPMYDQQTVYKGYGDIKHGYQRK